MSKYFKCHGYGHLSNEYEMRVYDDDVIEISVTYEDGSEELMFSATNYHKWAEDWSALRKEFVQVMRDEIVESVKDTTYNLGSLARWTTACAEVEDILFYELEKNNVEWED